MNGNIVEDYSKKYNKLLKKNLALYGNDISYYSEHKSIIIHKYVFRKPCNILDYGCGIGRNIPFLHIYFPNAKVSGCDIDEEGIRCAKKSNINSDFFLLNGHHIEKNRAKFDLILSSNVFHHIRVQDRVYFLLIIKHLLQPGGEIFIFEHNPHNPLTVHAVNTCPFDKGAVLLKSREMCALLSQIGFKKIRKRYTLYFPSRLRFLQPLESLFSFIPFGGQYFVHSVK